MKTTRRAIFLAIFALATTGAAVAAQPTVKNRQIRQQQRIHQGVRSGELTGPEAARLQRSSARIHRSIVKDRVDQGVFTPRERAQAQRKLNRQSKRIAVQKHDDNKR